VNGREVRKFWKEQKSQFTSRSISPLELSLTFLFCAIRSLYVIIEVCFSRTKYHCIDWYRNLFFSSLGPRRSHPSFLRSPSPLLEACLEPRRLASNNQGWIAIKKASNENERVRKGKTKDRSRLKATSKSRGVWELGSWHKEWWRSGEWYRCNSRSKTGTSENERPIVKVKLTWVGSISRVYSSSPLSGVISGMTKTRFARGLPTLGANWSERRRARSSDAAIDAFTRLSSKKNELEGPLSAK